MTHPTSVPRAAGRRLAGPAALARWVRRELDAERDRWFLWLPVAFGVGVAAYFALPFEPSPLPALVLAALGLAGVVACRRLGRDGCRPLLLGLTAAALGFGVAALRTGWTDAPSITRRGVHALEGRVIGVEEVETGRRLTLDSLRIERLAPEVTPATLRVTTRGLATKEPGIGDRLWLRATLMPPSPPTYPGGFDYARQAYFERLGGVGFALGRPRTIRAAEAGGGWSEGLARFRRAIDRSIRASVPGDAGAVASALLTGLRGGVSDGVWADMQASGLVHILSISGLHLTMVAGMVFLLARWTLAAIPWLALRVTPKKAAALVALVAALGYTLLAGAPVPCQRAFFMTAVALLAVVVDREPLSMRLVAVAALAVLALRPESLVGASFQLSFAAVVALIAVYEGPARRTEDAPAKRRGGALLYLKGVTVTTLVASVATTPLSLYHFQRIAAFGVVANLVAVPLSAFWIMPAGLIGMVLFPLGLDHPAWVVMGWGVEAMLATAHVIAALPGAALALPQPPPATLFLGVAGGLWLAIWRRPWRRLGVAGFALAAVAALLHRQPDVLVAAGGDLVAVRRDDGGLAISPWRRDAWVTEQWLRAYGLAAASPWPGAFETAGDLGCDDLGCVLARGGRRAAFARRGEALGGDCPTADLVVSFVPYVLCPRGGAAAVGLAGLTRGQGIALRFTADGVAVTAVRDRRGRRPWVR